MEYVRRVRALLSERVSLFPSNRRSLAARVKNELQDGRDHGYLTDEEHVRLRRLALRAIKANVRLSAYLRHAKAPEPFWREQAPREPQDTRGTRERREPRESQEPREPQEPQEPREP